MLGTSNQHAQCWEGYFENVIGYRLQINVISSVTIDNYFIKVM